MNDNTISGDDESRRAEIIERLADAAERAANKDPVADAAEADMLERILGNLGLTSTVPDELRDDALADVVSHWSDSGAELASTHRGGNSGIGAIVIDHTDEVDSLFDTDPGELSASIQVKHPASDESRLTVTIGVPSVPTDDVIAEVDVRGLTTPLRFPLQVNNQGSETFPLYELQGATTVLRRDLPGASDIVQIRLRPAGRPLDPQ